MEQMPLIYSRSRAVLILDKEVESNKQGHHDFLASMLHVSAYHNRYWTLQEAALAKGRYLYVASGNSVVSKMLKQHYVGLTSGMHIRRDKKSWEHCRKLRLINVWNELLGKTSTKRGELLAILANLLDLSATRILTLPHRDRMKAILANYKNVPLDMLFSASPRVGSRTDVNGQTPVHLNSDQDRWIPQFPGGVPIDTHSAILSASFEDDGLLISSDTQRLRLFMECSEPPQEGPFVLANQNTWVELFHIEEYLPPSTRGPAFYILHAQPIPASFLSRGYQGNGARLILQHITQDSQNRPRYSFIFDRSLVFGSLDARRQELGTTGREMIVEEVEDNPAVIFACDSASWPKVGFVRDFASMRLHSYFLGRYYRPVKNFSPPAFIFFAAFTIGFSGFAGVSDAEPDNVPGVVVFDICSTLFACTFTVYVCFMLGKAWSWQVLQLLWEDSFRPGHEADRPWSTRLDAALKERGELSLRYLPAWILTKVLLCYLWARGCIVNTAKFVWRRVSTRNPLPTMPDEGVRRRTNDVEMAVLALPPTNGGAESSTDQATIIAGS
ncbi:hypothetical protein LTR56_011705 [Elasticomyces elasticus]|nr:hypothetical protein LTR22_023956 [Elasticomyces elasticus]KAK3640828.1 hypothetical protein LTR56_011705 [Elasticomyces elasticus]KAK4921156.1 hypothetical protein LTR49_011343 [Elasticomyces elasticus]KAK5761873.1 hypothetical protein LTS12_007936 [Elasticomyces elasticus]